MTEVYVAWRPSHCPRCEQVFLANAPFHAEVSQLAATEGEAAARAVLDERLAKIHASHRVVLAPGAKGG